MAGALQELRRAIIAGESVDIDTDFVLLGSGARLDRKQPTNFHSLRGRGDPYLLEAIYYQYRFRDLPYNDYTQACRREGVAHLTPLDKKDLLAFLKGEIETCASIVSRPSDRAEEKAKTGTNASVIPTASADPVKQKDIQDRRKGNAESEKDGLSYAVQRKRVRDQRALDSVLMATNWDFSSLRDKLAQHITNAKLGKNSGKENGSKGQNYDPRGDRYTSNEDRFWRENLGSEFHELGIDMGGSFKAKPNAPNSTNGTSDKQRSRRDVRHNNTKEPPSKRPHIEAKDLIPIIIVPAGSTLVFAGNAVEFFQNGNFVSQEEMRKKNMAKVAASKNVVTRTPGGNCSRAEYHIITNPQRLTGADWDRVVAVVCSGQEWQFKNWPINDKGIQELFRRVQGFYFQYEDVVPQGNIEAWAIKKLQLSRSQRHTDGRVQFQFWNTLDAFLRRKGKQLRY